MLNFDVVVIGGGVAGALSALYSANEGAKVALISKGLGASALSSGAFDICGSPIFVSGLPWSKFLSIKDNFSEVIARKHFHPYSILALNFAEDPKNDAFHFLERATKFFVNSLESVGLRMKGEVHLQRPAPTILGTWKLTSFVQASQQLGSLQGSCAVVGIRGLALADASTLASSLNTTFSATGLGNIELEAMEIELDSRLSWTPEELSAYLAKPGKFNELKRKISQAGGGKYQTLLFPPLLSDCPQSEDELRLAEGTLLQEMLGTPGFMPGKRLQRTMSVALSKVGVCVFDGNACEFRKNGDTIISCAVRGNSQEEVGAGRWVLATGKFIGGGVKKNKSLKETSLGLPVFCDGRVMGEVFTPKLLDTHVLGEHAIFSAGVLTDMKFRPLNADGEVAYKNVYACGSILGGYNYHTDNCGVGVCIATGYKVGEEVLSRG